MTMPSPFELGAAIGGGVSGGIRQASERSAIDQILQQANESGNPDDIQNVMGQILQRVAPERQQLAAQILQQKQAQLQAQRAAQRQAQAYQAQGLDPSLANLEPGVQKEILKRQGQAAPFEAGLQTVQKMREIGRRGHLGIGSGIQGVFLGQARKDRGEYEQLGKSLIQLASTIPIRNKVEFETLAHNLYDPSLSDEKREGILDAMEFIINQGLQAKGGKKQETQQKRPSLEEIFG